MKKTTPALIATTLISTFLFIAMLMVGQDALSSSPSSASVASQNQPQVQLVSIQP